ncbi:peptidylprolyl isomerase [Legionella dresdenensis]|uniref:Peptidyl-prolyl cis-trans isomerase n=1 Tax=Legionella dresdenensis TaxID=450200 RepID=A0ABV8CCY7_9GAMM
MIIVTTSLGEIHIKLDDENTPDTADNFRSYVNSGFYDGTIFHRVIGNFMIQGGGLTPELTQKETQEPIKNEAKYAQPNKRGTIAMARTADPHSATAQFFINLVDNAFLNFSAENMQGYGYCVFGEVVEGMDVVDAIAKTATGNRRGYSDVPVEDIVIEKVVEVE